MTTSRQNADLRIRPVAIPLAVKNPSSPSSLGAPASHSAFSASSEWWAPCVTHGNCLKALRMLRLSTGLHKAYWVGAYMNGMRAGSLIASVRQGPHEMREPLNARRLNN